MSYEQEEEMKREQWQEESLEEELIAVEAIAKELWEALDVVAIDGRDVKCLELGTAFCVGHSYKHPCPYGVRDKHRERFKG